MRYNRFGFFSNKHNTGSQEPFELIVNVSESANDTAVTYTIDTNVPNSIDLVYTLSGNAISSDFTDNAIEGNISLDASGNATFVKQVAITNLNTDPTFGFQLRGQSNISSIIYTGNTYQVTSTNVPSFSVTNLPTPVSGNVTVGSDVYTVYNLNQELTPAQPPYPAWYPTYRSGNVTFSSLGANANATIEFLVIGGGGSAGAFSKTTYPEFPWLPQITMPSGGGGAGYDVISTTFGALTESVGYPFTIGNRGLKYGQNGYNPTSGDGLAGGNSSIMGLNVTGGGAGLSQSGNGLDVFNDAPAGQPNGASANATNVGGRGSRWYNNSATSANNGGPGNASLTGWYDEPNNLTATPFAPTGGGGSGSVSVNPNIPDGTPYFTTGFGNGGGVREVTTPGNPVIQPAQGQAGTIQIRWLQQVESRTITIT